MVQFLNKKKTAKIGGNWTHKNTSRNNKILASACVHTTCIDTGVRKFSEKFGFYEDSVEMLI